MPNYQQKLDTFDTLDYSLIVCYNNSRIRKEVGNMKKCCIDHKHDEFCEEIIKLTETCVKRLKELARYDEAREEDLANRLIDELEARYA